MEFKNQTHHHQPFNQSSSSTSSPSSSSSSSSPLQSNQHSVWDQFLTTTNPNSSTFDCCSDLDHHHQQLLETFCCSNELCLPFSDYYYQSCDQIDCTNQQPTLQNQSSSSDAQSQSQSQSQSNLQKPKTDSITLPISSASDCFCCDNGCPPSPILNNQCIDCIPSSTTSPAKPQSPSQVSIQNLIDSVSSGSNSIPQTPIINPSDSLSEDIVWINKELEELIRCCCCEEPTPCDNLPTHHADAHPSHHVSFDLLGTTSNTPQHPSNTSCPTASENASTYPQHQSIPAMIIPTRPPALLHTCQWKDCNSTFTSKQELINHVNSLHLFTASHPSNHTSNPQQYQSDLDSALLHSLSSSHTSTPSQSLSDQMKHLFATCSIPSLDHFCCPDSVHPNQHSDSSTLKTQRTSGPIQPRPHSPLSNSNPLMNAQEIFKTFNRTTDVHPPTPSLASTAPTPCSIIQTSDPAKQPSSRSTQTHATSSATKLYHCHWKSCNGHSYLTTAQLTEHISTDHIGSGKSSYTCLWEGCPGNGKSFNQRQKVMRHLQSHTGDRPFECEMCEKRFGEMATLVQHRRTHTNEKPYKCTYEDCKKSFALQSALTIHKRTHTGDKPFKCSVLGCMASFGESSNLSKHMKTHLGLKNFECQVCEKRFGRSDQLARHMGIHEALLGGGGGRKRAGGVDGRDRENGVGGKKRK